MFAREKVPLSSCSKPSLGVPGAVHPGVMALLFLLATAVSCAATRAVTRLSPIDELRTSFTVGGDPVPPEIFRDMGDGDMADSGSIIVSIDVKAATGSNRYADPIKRNGDWVSQSRPDPDDRSVTQEEAYRFIGMTSNKLLVAVTSYSGGGSGVFYTLHILSADPGYGIDGDGKRYERLNVSTVRGIPLGDRWDGDVGINGNTIAITTRVGVSEGHEPKPSTRIVKAERP